MSLYETGVVIVKDLGTKKVNRPSRKLGYTFERFYLVKCYCGVEFETRAGNFKAGSVKSCGCGRLRKTTKHGKHHTSEWRSWKAMKQRCLNPNIKRWDRYGGRGITVCKRWRDSFQNFYDDMGDKPAPEYSIDRINPDGNYEPSNCRWADPYTQTHNRSKKI